MKKHLVGFDPGGSSRGSKFGWCVAEDSRRQPVPVVDLGVVDHAGEAVRAAFEVVHAKGGNVIGVGIDAPLYWIVNGDRAVGQLLRRRIIELGAPNGTVQAVNSLCGACLVQGMLAGVLSGRRPTQPLITESHPKALLWLLKKATSRNPPKGITPFDLQEFFSMADELRSTTEHERDAALACLSAWAMVHPSAGWRDIAPDEHQERFSLIDPPPAYWIPG